MAAKRRHAICPGCGKARSVDAQKSLTTEEQRRMALAGASRRWSWACDDCLRKGRAVRADIASPQGSGLGRPSPAYADIAFRCSLCGADAVFTAREQRHWYEELGFARASRPVACAPCRAAVRRAAAENKRLSRLLEARLQLAEPKSAADLATLAELYADLGMNRKAAEMRARAANARKRRR